MAIDVSIPLPRAPVQPPSPPLPCAPYAALRAALGRLGAKYGVEACVLATPCGRLVASPLELEPERGEAIAALASSAPRAPTFHPAACARAIRALDQPMVVLAAGRPGAARALACYEATLLARRALKNLELDD